MINDEDATGNPTPFYERFEHAEGVPQALIHLYTGNYIKNPLSMFSRVNDIQWNSIREVVKLSGHKNDINLIEFSRDGQSLMTASKDGTIRIYRV